MIVFLPLDTSTPTAVTMSWIVEGRINESFASCPAITSAAAFVAAEHTQHHVSQYLWQTQQRSEMKLSTFICSQREPASWETMILNDEISANAILKRATKHYTVVIRPKSAI